MVYFPLVENKLSIGGKYTFHRWKIYFRISIDGFSFYAKISVAT
ncbi:hypothetical protein PORCAN_399 [Porphyromonas crevioricanis JCM 13913]|nr:hypothetical protein PORCAN_399 [Porphyromonas crevioricanis JCM 13913]